MVGAVEGAGVLHFRAGDEAAIELEAPGVVGALQKAGVTVRLGQRGAGGGFGETAARVSGRQDVHGAMRADAGEDARGAIGIANGDEGFAEEIDGDEVAGFGDLGDVGDGEPVGGENVLAFPLMELGALVELAGEAAGVGEWDVADGVELIEEALKHGGRLAGWLGAEPVGGWEWRELGGGAEDEIGEGGDHLLEELSAFLGGGLAGETGDAVAAGLGDGVGENGAGGAVGIVGGGEAVAVDEVGVEMEHEAGLGTIGVEVLGVIGVGAPDVGGELEDVAEADLQGAEVAEADLIDSDASGGVIAEVGVDEKQSLPAGGGGPGGEVVEGGDEGLVAEGEGAGPFGGVTLGDGVAEGAQHGDTSGGGDGVADGFREQGVHGDGEMGAVLLGRAEREEEQAAVELLQFGDVWPGEVLEVEVGVAWRGHEG